MARVRGCLLLLSVFVTMSVNAQDKDSIAVLKTAQNFVTAFNKFDWPTFRASFTDDATIFYPFWDRARRVQGRQDFETVWLNIFPEFADKNNKDTLQINPKDIHIQMYGSTAILSFHLGDGQTALSRRTLVMLKQSGSWRIAHLHASSVSRPKE
ncbi:MAG: nuclear transport factor 2 family protein [Chitinophagaceae bacterium]